MRRREGEHDGGGDGNGRSRGRRDARRERDERAARHQSAHGVSRENHAGGRRVEGEHAPHNLARVVRLSAEEFGVERAELLVEIHREPVDVNHRASALGGGVRPTRTRARLRARRGRRRLASSRVRQTSRLGRQAAHLAVTPAVAGQEHGGRRGGTSVAGRLPERLELPRRGEPRTPIDVLPVQIHPVRVRRRLARGRGTGRYVGRMYVMTQRFPPPKSLDRMRHHTDASGRNASDHRRATRARPPPVVANERAVWDEAILARRPRGAFWKHDGRGRRSRTRNASRETNSRDRPAVTTACRRVVQIPALESESRRCEVFASHAVG